MDDYRNSRKWDGFDQSCVSRTETVHGTLRFLYLSHNNPRYALLASLFSNLPNTNFNSVRWVVAITVQVKQENDSQKERKIILHLENELRYKKS